MRIAVGGFLHETNTFALSPTTWEDFVRADALPALTDDDAIYSIFRGLNVATQPALRRERWQRGSNLDR